MVVGGDQIGLRSSGYQPKGNGRYRRVQGMGGRVVQVVDLV